MRRVFTFRKGSYAVKKSVKKDVAYSKFSFILSVYFFIFFSVFCIQACFASYEVDNTPIDVVYKYIDLTDKNLVRQNIPPISKDYDNEELRYSLRSVLKNIPWVRKIFIIMPNEKVSYLKDKNGLEDRIEYIKDKDLIGFDSASSITFEHEGLRKLKEFGVSEHFIYMNDDYFVGKPLEKSYFFYFDEEKDKVLPYIFYKSRSLSQTMQRITDYNYESHKYLLSKKCMHTSADYRWQTCLGYKLLYKIFGRNDILIPNSFCTVHNATPYTISDLNEVHDAVRDNYEYAEDCFKSQFRNNKQITHETFLSFYLLNKYNRRCGEHINNFFMGLRDVKSYTKPNSLFCVNTGSDHYSDVDFLWSKFSLQKLFPTRTKYEIPELEDGEYEIESALDPNRVLDIPSSSKDDRTKIQLWTRNGTNAQKFIVKYNKNGFYTIKSKCSGKMLDVACSGNECGTKIWQFKNNGTDAQNWYIIPGKLDYFYIISKCNNLCIDVPASQKDEGTSLQCFEINCTSAQKFKFKRSKS